jgi:arrestin-related trafficking adapter 1
VLTSCQVSYNTPANSSGALFSAQLQLDVIDPDVTVESFDVELSCSVFVKKPVHQHCPECMTKTTGLKKISLTPEPLVLAKGMHKFPFSYLFPGHLPASIDSALVKLEYSLTAVAKTSTGEKISFIKNIPLSRSVLPGNDKHSIRVFPPTNLTASVNLNPCIHPIGEFPVSLRLSGITSKTNDATVRWRLRKLNWRIEEHQKMISPACAKHAAKLGGTGKGILHEDIRTIGEADINYHKTPWKSDFDAGEVDAEFNCAINPVKHPVCDVEAPNGLSITHTLVVEMVVAEDWSPKNKPSQVTPTGSARILRTQFHLLLTERPGLGISWDEETPPVYEDVPASPPHYQGMTDFDLAEIGGQMEEIHFDPNTNQIASTASSSSSSSAAAAAAGARPSTAGSGTSGGARNSADIPAYSRGRFILDVDDLLSGPPETRRESTTEAAHEDIQIVQADPARR